MMRRSKLFILIAVLLAAVLLAAAALAESTPLAGLWNSGCDLLFHTDNVTLTGEATFSLDGKRFKTAELNYIQDGYSSYYGLKLLTPKKDGTEQETGWIIIGDEEGFVTVMEAYYPGTYRNGHGSAHNTLLRRSIQLDALTELGGLLAGQLEPMLPDGAISVTEENGVKTVQIKLSGDQIPAVAVSALNTAAGYLSDRWFSYSHDRNMEYYDQVFDNYVTVTQALTDGTAKWTLTDADIEAVLDDQGRFSAVSGTIKVTSTFYDGTDREVEVQFSLSMKDYGASHVKPFDPADYNVVLQETESWEGDAGYEILMDDAAWDDLRSQVGDLLGKQGFTVSDQADWGGWLSSDGVSIWLEDPADTFLLVFSNDGSLVNFQRVTAEWLIAEEQEAEGIDPDTLAAADALMRSFIAEVNPSFVDLLGDLELQCAIPTEDGSLYAAFHDSKENAHFVIRLEPSPRIEYYFAARMEE